MPESSRPACPCSQRSWEPKLALRVRDLCRTCSSGRSIDLMPVWAVNSSLASSLATIASAVSLRDVADLRALVLDSRQSEPFRHLSARGPLASACVAKAVPRTARPAQHGRREAGEPDTAQAEAIVTTCAPMRRAAKAPALSATVPAVAESFISRSLIHREADNRLKNEIYQWARLPCRPERSEAPRAPAGSPVARSGPSLRSGRQRRYDYSPMATRSRTTPTSGRSTKIIMLLEPLTAVSSVDGRYRATTAALAGYFSEYALMRNRLVVECEYLRLFRAPAASM